MLKSLTGLLLIAALGCTGSVDNNRPDNTPDPDELIGAGDRDITLFWPDIDLPYSQNTKVLTFEMLRNEIQRATAHSWQIDGLDQWDRNRSALGAPDYINTFDNDRTMSQQKIVAIRKMAFTVCNDLVIDDGAGSPVIFSVVAPTAAIADGADARSQTSLMFERFFLVAPTAAELDESMSLLLDLQTQATSAEAWRGLCSAYLASMRFLSY